MKLAKWLFVACSLGAPMGAAIAADLPIRKALPPMIAPGYSWSGFYIGVNAGAGFGDGDRGRSIFLPANSVVGSLGTDGVLTLPGRGNRDAFFVGGGQIGYNFQATPGAGWVWGVEADFQYVDMPNFGGGTFPATSYTFVPTTGLSRGLAFAPPPATVITNSSGGLDFLGTVRGRVGYAFDSLLLYVTGGFAYGTGGNNGNFGGDDNIRFGYAVGGGFEYGFTRNWSVKVEGLYVDLDRRGNRTVQGTGVFVGATNTVTITSGNSGGGAEFGLARAGLNYRF